MGIPGVPNGNTVRPDVAAMRQQMLERLRQANAGGAGKATKDGGTRGAPERPPGADAARVQATEPRFVSGDGEGLSTEELTQLATSLAPQQAAEAPTDPMDAVTSSGVGREGKVSDHKQLGYEIRRLIDAYRRAEVERSNGVAEESSPRIDTEL